jgi:hypothetical protein
VLESRVDHTRVVLMLRKAGNLPLVKDYLMSVQKTNLSAVNEAVNELLIEEEDFEVCGCCLTKCGMWLWLRLLHREMLRPCWPAVLCSSTSGGLRQAHARGHARSGLHEPALLRLSTPLSHCSPRATFQHLSCISAHRAGAQGKHHDVRQL